MSQAILSLIFIARTGIDYDAGMRNIGRAWLMQNTYSILQLVNLVIHLVKVENRFVNHTVCQLNEQI